jgi:hypothetical protein
VRAQHRHNRARAVHEINAPVFVDEEANRAVHFIVVLRHVKAKLLIASCRQEERKKKKRVQWSREATSSEPTL